VPAAARLISALVQPNDMLIIPSGGSQWAWLALDLTRVVLRLSLRLLSIGTNEAVLCSFHARYILADGPAYHHRIFRNLTIHRLWVCTLSTSRLWPMAASGNLPGG
jgi:hypothetical protein